MKKRHVVLLCIGVLVLLLTVLIVIKKIEDDQKYVIRGEIASVEVVDSLRRGRRPDQGHGDRDRREGSSEPVPP